MYRWKQGTSEINRKNGEYMKLTINIPKEMQKKDIRINLNLMKGPQTSEKITRKQAIDREPVSSRE